MAGQFLSATQAASELGVSPGRIRQLLEAGQLPGTKIGRDWLIRRAHVERYRALPPGRKGRPRTLRRGRRPPS